MISNRLRPVLVVEDNDLDYEALVWALGEAPGVRLIRCFDGEQVKKYFAGSEGGGNGAAPALILLDLNLPGMKGIQVLEFIRKSAIGGSLPVVILSSSSNPVEIEECYRSGANSYFVKPLELQELKSLVTLLMDYWLERAALPGKVVRTVENK